MGKAELHYSKLSPSTLNREVRSGGIDEAAISELAESIRQHGVLQPLVVCATPWAEAETPFEIIAGERRWRAVASLGDEAPLLPCQIVPAGDEVGRLILMGTENLQRENLTPLEEARFYRGLIGRGLNLDEVVRRMRKSRSHVKRYLNILDMPQGVQDHIEARRIPLTAAKYLQKLAPKEMELVAEKLVGQKVIAFEMAVQKILACRTGQRNGNGLAQKNGNGLVRAEEPKPEAAVVSRLVGMLFGVIKMQADMLEEYADMLSALDPEAATAVWNELKITRRILAKVQALEVRQ